MKKNAFTGQTIGLFFSRENEAQRNRLALAFVEEGATVRSIKNEEEIGVMIIGAGPAVRPRAIISDANILSVKTADAMTNANVESAFVSLLPKGARIIPGQSRDLENFVLEVLNKES